MKSDLAKKGIERAPHRSLFKAIGYTDDEIKKPQLLYDRLMALTPDPYRMCRFQ